MGFLTPFMLFGAVAAAIPVAIHFFFRSRYRTVPWAAMKFLLTSVEQTSRRLKFQELLLLLLRMAVLIMLALAFARPISLVVRGNGRGDAVDAVFVIDTSFSMGANDGAKTRFEKAKEQAITLIDELPPQSTVQIITCAGNSSTEVGPRSPANLDQAKKLVQNLELTSLATDLAVGVSVGKNVLDRGQAPNKELYVFSDMQQSGFDPQAGKLKAVLNAVKEKAVVHFVRCGTRPVKNAAIVSIAPQDEFLQPGDRIPFSVKLVNTGTDALEKVDVTLMVDGDAKNREPHRITKLAPGEEYGVTLYGKLAKPGLHVLTAQVSGDDLEGDNRFDQVVLVRNQVNVLVVDGSAHKESEPDRAASYYLMFALLPAVKDMDRAKFYVQPRVVPARLASPALLAKNDICILVDVSLQARANAGQTAGVLPSDFIEALGPFVRKGHGLILFGGENVQPEPYNKLLDKKLGLLPMPLKSTLKADADKPLKVNRGSFDLPSFAKFKDDDYYRKFNEVCVWQTVELDETPANKPAAEKKEGDKKDQDPVSVLLRLNDGKALVADRKVDAGEVIFVGTSAHCDLLREKSMRRTWTDWPIDPTFVPFIQATVNHLLHTQTQTYNVAAGQPLKWYPKDKHDHAYYLVHPDGKKVERLGVPEKVGKQFVVTANDLPRAGVYYLTSMPRSGDDTETVDAASAIKTGTPIAVIPDLAESKDLTTLTDPQIDTQLGFTPIHIIAGESADGSTGADRINREWTVWALMAVLALVLFEVVFAWWCGRAW